MLDISTIDRILNAQAREICGVKKWVEENLNVFADGLGRMEKSMIGVNGEGL